jgi:hypothetical protein
MTKAMEWAAFFLLVLAACALCTVSYLLGEAHGKFGERLRFAQLILEQSKQSTPGPITEGELKALCESYYFRNPEKNGPR